MSPGDVGGLTRRKLLLGLTTAGVAGAMTGVGTASMFRDVESFGRNRLQTGALDLLVTCDSGDCQTSSQGALNLDVGSLGPDNQSETASFSIELPETVGAIDGPEVPNNPACPWIRLGCPEPTDIEVLSAVSTTLVYVAPDGSRTTVFDGTLLELAFDDHLLVGDRIPGVGCLDPGDVATFELTWSLDPTGLKPEATQLSVTYYFAAIQRRHTDPHENPWGLTDPLLCEVSGLKGISYVAFCGDDEVDVCDLELVALAEEDGGQPTIVEWSYTGPGTIDGVVMKSGAGKGGNSGPGTVLFPGGTGGLLFVGSPEGTVFDADSNRNPCPDGNTLFKFECDDGECGCLRGECRGCSR
ncbi:MAG: hypothetical protein ACQETI_03640 [Halobacteriota archaeon]